jgi:hypothetical protein
MSRDKGTGPLSQNLTLPEIFYLKRRTILWDKVPVPLSLKNSSLQNSLT